MRSRLSLLALALALFGCVPAATAGDERTIVRVAVLDNSPPMAFRDAQGELTGFSVAMIRILCEEMKINCVLQATSIERVLDQVAAGEVDIGAVSLLETPERRARVIFAKPYFRSISLWFAKPGVLPTQSGVRVAVVHGSAQERYALGKAWNVVTVHSNGDLGEPLVAGKAQAAIIPMATGLSLMKRPDFSNLGLVTTVMNEPELTGDTSFIISPRFPELKAQMDMALDRIKRNGVYDRINSQFLPFRVN